MIKKSNNWKYKIEVKQYFVDDDSLVTPEHTLYLCNFLITSLEQIKKQVEESNIVNDDKEHVASELEELIDNFKFLKSLVDGTIKEDEWEDYCYDGNHLTMFNDYLEQLYDLGDLRVITKQNISEKFIWVG